MLTITPVRNSKYTGLTAEKKTPKQACRVNSAPANYFYAGSSKSAAAQISFGGYYQAAGRLCSNFNKPVVSYEHIKRWINQFPKSERRIASRLAEIVDYHTYSDVFEEVQSLHKKVCSFLAKDGFDTKLYSDVDFTKSYNCKSGDIVSYMYRKANKIRGICFKSMEGLILDRPKDIRNRALVLLDDYTGSGGQFLSEFYVRNDANRELINSYRKIYFAPLVANISSVKKFRDIAKGEYDKVAELIIRDCPENHEDGVLRSALRRIANKKLQLVAGKIEYPILSKRNKTLTDAEKEELRKFLLKYDFDTPLGYGNVQGSTVFFYSAPNNTPDVLWNSKLQERGLFPLFPRTNDISIYPFSRHMPPEEQIW